MQIYIFFYIYFLPRFKFLPHLTAFQWRHTGSAAPADAPLLSNFLLLSTVVIWEGGGISVVPNTSPGSLITTSLHHWVKPRAGRGATEWNDSSADSSKLLWEKFGIIYTTFLSPGHCWCFARLTCPIRLSPARRVRSAACPGEWAGWPGLGTQERGKRAQRLPGRIPAGASMVLAEKAVTNC